MYKDRLIELNACKSAVDWSSQFTTSQEAWNACDRGDWMLWLAAKIFDKKTVVLCACECARLSLHYIPAEELRPLVAIKIAEAWARNEASLSDVVGAANAAARAASAARTTRAARAAHAAVAAARIAYITPDAANSATYTAAHAAYAAACISRSAVRFNIILEKTLSECANICRKYFPVLNLN